MNDELRNEMLFALFDLEMNKEDATAYVMNALQNVTRTEVEATYKKIFETLTY